MEDDIAIMLGTCMLYSSGVVSGNTMSMWQASKLAAIALGRARSPEMIGLLGAATAYPERTQLSENGIAGIISAAYREKRQEGLDSLAGVMAKLMDRLER